MYNIEESFERLILAHAPNRPTVVFTETDPRVIEAVCHLVRFVQPVLLVTEETARGVVADSLTHLEASRVDFAFSECTFIDIATRVDLLSEFALAYVEESRSLGEPVSLEQAQKCVKEPGLFGIMAVKLGHADTVVGGASLEPRAFFRPMSRILAGPGGFCGEAGVFVLQDDYHGTYPQNIVVFGDVGVNATMTAQTLAQVAVGTCVVARDLIPEDILPDIRGVIVSYSNKGSDVGPSPELVREATQLLPGVLQERVQSGGKRYQSIHLDGEVKMSAALSERSAMYYQRPGHNATWEGGPTAIITPNLEVGNLLYHGYATRFPEAKKFTVMFGTRFRAVSLAMDTTPEDIRLSVKASLLRMVQDGAWKHTPRDTFFRRYRVLAVNPGSTSTKISVHEGNKECFTEELQHSAEELLPFEGKGIAEQFEFRKSIVLNALSKHGLSPQDIDAVAGRGGLLRPIAHGTYRVNDAMVEELKSGVGGEHASNLGGLIAREIVAGTDKPAFIVDPVVVDEVDPRVKVTGIKALRRKIISHALNQIATARRYAEENGTFCELLNVIVCHMGGGISIGAHKKGRYIDVNNALDGEGPFSPQRSGSLPTGQLIELCFSGRYTLQDLKKLNKGRGGLIDLLGTADLREVENRVASGDPLATEVFEAMAYQISKEVCSVLPAFDGEPLDRVLLTGGMARCKPLVEKICKYVSALGCGVTTYPGENEMFALTKGALRVLSGKEAAREYTKEA